MTREELLNKEVIKIKDIQDAYEVSYNTACGIIKSVRSYSDRLGIAGCMHVLDYLEWLNAKSKTKQSGE